MSLNKILIIALSLLLLLVSCEQQIAVTQAITNNNQEGSHNKALVNGQLSTTKLTKISQQSLNKLAQSLQVKYQFFSNIETDCPDLKGAKVAHCYSAF